MSNVFSYFPIEETLYNKDTNIITYYDCEQCPIYYYIIIRLKNTVYGQLKSYIYI